jgi:hypothetical protein
VEVEIVGAADVKEDTVIGIEEAVKIVLGILGEMLAAADLTS